MWNKNWVHLSVFLKVSKVFWKLQNKSRDVLKIELKKIRILQWITAMSKNLYNNYREANVKDGYNN